MWGLLSWDTPVPLDGAWQNLLECIKVDLKDRAQQSGLGSLSTPSTKAFPSCGAVPHWGQNPSPADCPMCCPGESLGKENQAWQMLARVCTESYHLLIPCHEVQMTSSGQKLPTETWDQLRETRTTCSSCIQAAMLYWNFCDVHSTPSAGGGGWCDTLIIS